MSVTDVINQIKSAGATGGSLAEASPEQLKSLAAQFESMLVSEMLKGLRSSMFESGDDSSTSSAPLADTLFTELSLAISRAGGLGFGDFMVKTMPGSVSTEKTEMMPGSFSDALSTEKEPGIISSAFGWRKDPINGEMKFHKGLDIALPHGHEVPAPEPGRVVFAGEQPGYGKTVVIDHGGRVTTRYAHLSEISVSAGDEVTAGQVFGKVGATGRATGPHLHVEVVEAGQHVNPAEKLATYIASRPQ